jgi:hypothetical protein
VQIVNETRNETKTNDRSEKIEATHFVFEERETGIQSPIFL